MGGGGYLRNATNPATLPTNGLVLGGTLPSTGATPVDAAAADGAVDLSHWTAIANFTGQSEAGDQAATFALCATGRAGAHGRRDEVDHRRQRDAGGQPADDHHRDVPAGTRLIGGGA